MILISVNSSGGLTSATETVRQGNTIQMFVSAPYHTGTCRLIMWKPTEQTPLYEDVAIDLTSLDGQKVYGFTIPKSVTTKAGTVIYQFSFTQSTTNDNTTTTNVTYTDKGSFTVGGMLTFSVPASVSDLSSYTLTQLYDLINSLNNKLSFYDATTGKIDISGDLDADGTATLGKIVSTLASIDRVVTKQVEHQPIQVTQSGIVYNLIDLIKVGSTYKVIATRVIDSKEQLVIGNQNTEYLTYATYEELPTATAGDDNVYYVTATDKFYIVNTDVEYEEIQKIKGLCPTSWQQLGGSGGAWGEISGTLSNQTDLQSALDAKANASNVSAIEGKIPTEATSSNKLADKSYVGDVVSNAFNTIDAKIPASATASNQLADKAFVNSSIATNTSNYISNNGQPFTSLAQLQAYTGTVTNNDYAFITGTDSAGNTYYDRYKATVSGSTTTWALEYRLNNSSFTTAQWNALNSGITASKISSIDNSISAINTALDSKASSENLNDEAVARENADDTLQDNIDAIPVVSGTNDGTNWTAIDIDGTEKAIPQTNNPTITITQNGATKGSFTLNQSGDATINLSPTFLSAITGGGSEGYFTTSACWTSYTYTGKSITIPANTFVLINVKHNYSSQKPAGVLLSFSDTSATGDVLCASNTDNPRTCSSFYYAQNSEKTLYIWAKMSSASSSGNAFNIYMIQFRL